MNVKAKKYEGSFLILLSALMFGSYGAFSRYLSQYDIFFQTYIKSFLIVIMLVGIGLFKKDFKKINKEDLKWFAVVLIFTCMSIAPITYAFRHLELGTTSFLFYASLTIFTYIFGFTFFKEKLNRTKIACFVLAIIGMILIFSFGLSSALLLIPILMAVLNGLASSGEVTFSKKLSGKYSNIQITTLIFLAIGITHLIVSLLIGEKQDLSLLVTSAAFVQLAFAFATVIGMLTVIAGFKYIDPSIGAIIGLMEIVFSVLLGIVLFQESLDIKIIIGGILIIIAAALPSVKEYIDNKKLKHEI